MNLFSRVFSSKILRRVAFPSPILQRTSRALPQDNNVSKRWTGSYGPTSVLKLDSDLQELYGHSSGRWLWNENQQLAFRYLSFDYEELARLSAPAVGSQSCVRFKKLSGGSFNKAFLLTMDDGKEVIAKLPNPNAGYKQFTTASEVATMDYVRNVLGIPVPQVYLWSSSTENTVGAEYILMEKCRGVELCKVWDEITDRQKATIIQKLVSFEAAFTTSRFPLYGSLYYTADLQSVKEGQQVILDPKQGSDSAAFSVGPTTDRTFFDHNRTGVHADRGPWPTLEDYNLAIAHRELACLNQYSEFPDQQGFFYGPGQYQPRAEVKARALKNFKKVSKYLKPKDPILSRATLWHTDLHSDNIFVDRQDPTEITAIIDWQAVHIAPLFAQARHPTFLQFDGEIPTSFEASNIKLPDNYNDLDEEAQKAARKLRGAQLLWKLYIVELECQCSDIKRAIRFGESLMGKLPGFAGNVFSDGELLVEDLLIQLQEVWEQIVDDPITDPCPLNFSHEDKLIHEEQFALWAHSIQLMTSFLDEIGGYRGWNGWVSHEQYNAAKQKMTSLQEKFLSQHASTDEERTKWMAAWPFKD